MPAKKSSKKTLQEIADEGLKSRYKKVTPKEEEELSEEEVEDVETGDSGMFDEEGEEEEEEGNYIEQDLERRQKERVREQQEKRRLERNRANSVKKANGNNRRPVMEREPERDIQTASKRKKPIRQQTQPARKSDGHYYRSWNDLRLEGKVKNEVEMNYVGDGLAKTTFTLQVYQGKEKMPAFIHVTCWDELAEEVSENIIEGSRVKVLGCLNQYKSKEGRYYTGVTADVVEEMEDYEG